MVIAGEITQKPHIFAVSRVCALRLSWNLNGITLPGTKKKEQNKKIKHINYLSSLAFMVVLCFTSITESPSSFVVQGTPTMGPQGLPSHLVLRNSCAKNPLWPALGRFFFSTPAPPSNLPTYQRDGFEIFSRIFR